ncbi:CyP450 monooxygenase [Trametes maxima]|nr:CyP450 monooxygenase [Trametes maxima]
MTIEWSNSISSGYVVPLTIVTLVLFYLRSELRWKARTHGLSHPPGPRSWPEVGSVFSMPKFKPWEGFRDMCAQYGDIIFMQVPGQSMLVLSSANSAIEYLEKRSANTSDRPQNPVVELTGQSFNLAFMPYGAQWRAHRRTFWQHFHPGTVSKYRPIQRASAHRFLARLLDSPSHLKQHIRHAFSATMLKALYDIEVTGEEDERVRIMDAAVGAITAAAPGDFAVEMFPFLRHVPMWVPGAGFQKIFAECKVANEHLKHVLFDQAKDSLVDQWRRSCILTEMRARSATKDDSDILPDEEILKNICIFAFEAGADTTFSITYATFVALALYPEAQQRAQAELDAVVGPYRLPDYTDVDALVYVHALILEVLRWHLVTPLSIPHRTIADDEFRGYFIPAGTTVCVNMWAILHDPEMYDRPNEFLPERFIRDGKLDFTAARDPTTIMFGFGRRVCAGRYFARNSLFITIASVLHVFTVGLPLDEDGRPIQIKYEQSHGLLSYPVDGRCSITPRSPAAEVLILNAQNPESIVQNIG